MSLLFPKSDISELCSIKNQSRFALAAVFCSLDLWHFQESWASGAPGRAKGKQLLRSPRLLLLPTSGLGPLQPSLNPALASVRHQSSLSDQKGIFSSTSKGSDVLCWMDALIYYSMNSLGFAVSQLKASQLIQRECRCLRFSQRTNFPFYRFLSFPHCRGEGNISQFFCYGKQ